MSFGQETVDGALPLSGGKLGVWDSAGALRFLGEGSCGFGGFFFFWAALAMRTSKAEGREADIVLIALGFDLMKIKQGFDEREREERRDTLPAKLRETEKRINLWRHGKTENINREEEREN